MFLKAAAYTAKAAKIILLTGFYIIMGLFIACGIYMFSHAQKVSSGAFLTDDLKLYSPEANVTVSESANDDENLTLTQLKTINPDVIGWLHIYGTDIDYPLLQGQTDMEYLNKDVYGDFSLSGSIFLSSLNNSGLSDGYNLVYGHHMENGAMFGGLDKFTDKDYFESHSEGIVYITDGENISARQIKLFSLIHTDAYDKYVFSASDEILTDERAAYFTDHAALYIGASSSGRLISFVTCSESETNGRLVLTGWLYDAD